MRGLLCALALFVWLGCATTLPAELADEPEQRFEQVDPTFIPGPRAVSTHVILNDLSDRDYTRFRTQLGETPRRVVGVITIRHLARIGQKEFLRGAAELGAHVGCDAVVDYSIYRLVDVGGNHFSMPGRAITHVGIFPPLVEWQFTCEVSQPAGLAAVLPPAPPQQCENVMRPLSHLTRRVCTERPYPNVAHGAALPAESL